LRQIIVL